MTKLNVAIIGCSRIAHIAHLPGYQAASDLCDIKYFVDPLKSAAEDLCRLYGKGEVLTDYHDILSDPELDCVSVCTPNNLHAPISIDFMRAGKNVLCEKPAANSIQTVREMRDIAKETGKILNIGVCMRYDTTVNKVHNRIQAGDLGEIYHIYCSFRAHRAIPGLGGPFTQKARSGGGVLIDWGIHYLDLIDYCMDGLYVNTVSAITQSRMGNPISEYVCKEMWAGPRKSDGIYDVEDFVSALIRTDSASISLNGAWAQNIGEDTRYIEFLGTKGGIHLDYLGGFTYYSSQDGMLTETHYDYNQDDMYAAEIRGFLESASAGVKNRANIDHAIRTSELMDLIYRSAEEGHEISVR